MPSMAVEGMLVGRAISDGDLMWDNRHERKLDVIRVP